MATPGDAAGSDTAAGCTAAAPGTSVTLMRAAATLAMTDIGMGGTQVVTATPQQTLRLDLRYTLTDQSCPANCIDQIEVGWEPGGRYGCVFDGQVPKTSGVTGSVSFPITAPAMPGTYDLRTNISQDYTCSSHGGWWGGTPDAVTTIVRLCVQ